MTSRRRTVDTRDVKQGACHVATFGCRVNRADSEGMLDVLKAQGMLPTENPSDAEVVIVNSCTVTHRSDADIRKLVNRVHRENPGAKVVVTGCYAQRDPDALAALPGTTAVIGQSDTAQLGAVVASLRLKTDGPADSTDSSDSTGPIVLRRPMDAVDPESLPVDPVAVAHDRTRPFIKIQDGCDAKCTYCVIPSVRGPARSAEATKIIRSVQRLVDDGYFEIVLAGVHLGTYAGGVGLHGLVTKILSEVPTLGRLRLSCIEPMAFPEALIELATVEPRLAPHFHLPLQAGSDAVLKRMGRPYRVAAFGETIGKIRNALPHAFIGTDVIVGFPGETDDDFERTCDFVQSIGLSALHVFSYSDRPGVPSTRLRPKVDPRHVKHRSIRLNEIGARLHKDFLDAQVGKTLSGVTLEHRETRTEALSDNYCPIHCETELPGNRIFSFEIMGSTGKHLVGKPV